MRPNVRPAIRQLLRQMEVSAKLSTEPCWVLRVTGRAALLVPTPDGQYRFARGFLRSTVTEAMVLGLVRLGDELADVPQYGGGGNLWSWDGGHLKGRTIHPVRAMAR